MVEPYPVWLNAQHPAGHTWPCTGTQHRLLSSLRGVRLSTNYTLGLTQDSADTAARNGTERVVLKVKIGTPVQWQEQPSAGSLIYSEIDFQQSHIEGTAGLWKSYPALARFPTCTQLAAGQCLMGSPIRRAPWGPRCLQLHALPRRRAEHMVLLSCPHRCI